MEQLPTYWYNTKAFWIGTVCIDHMFSFLTAGATLRLSSLGDEATTQVVLSHASILLDPTAFRSSSPPRETAEGLLRTRMPPLCYYLAYRVNVPR